MPIPSRQASKAAETRPSSRWARAAARALGVSPGGRLLEGHDELLGVGCRLGRRGRPGVGARVEGRADGHLRAQPRGSAVRLQRRRLGGRRRARRAQLPEEACVSLAPLVRGLDRERPPGGLGGFGEAPLCRPDTGQVVVGDGRIGRPPEDDQRLCPPAEGCIVVGLEREGTIEGFEGSRRIAEPQLDAAEGGPGHGPVGSDRDRVAVGGGGIFESTPQDRHVASPEGLLVPLEESLGHRSRLPDREESGRPSRGARLVSASCTAAPCGPA
jgi:hypothetical protein